MIVPLAGCGIDPGYVGLRARGIDLIDDPTPQAGLRRLARDRGGCRRIADRLQRQRHGAVMGELAPVVQLVKLLKDRG